MALTKLNFTGQGLLPSASMPTGSVLQSITTSDATASTYTGTDSANPKTVISGSITPSATNSKILITGFIQIGLLQSSYGGALHYLGVRLKRGATVIGEPTSLSSLTSVFGSDASGARPMHSTGKDEGGYSASRSMAIPFHFADSPNTTNATTYNIQGVIEKLNQQYTMIKNGAGYNYNNDEAHMATCNLTLQEIKG